MSAELAAIVDAQENTDLVDVGGVGGTLAGNVLSTAAMRATLGRVLTDAAFRPHDLAGHIVPRRRRNGDQPVRRALVHRPAGRPGEYRFTAPAPRTGTDSAAAHDDDLEEYLHLFLSNRGVLATPFHNMALMCPTTSQVDVDTHTRLFDEAVAALI